MLTTGLLGASRTTSASASASSTPGRGLGGLGADEDEPPGRQRAAVADPPLLEVDRGLAPRRRRRARRRASRPGRRWPAAGARPGCHRAHSASVTADSGIAGIEHPGADQVCGDVPVAEAEPGRLGAVGRELLLDRPGLAGAAPAALRVGAAAQGVHDAVEVGADPQPVQGHVVADVDHGGDVGARAVLAAATHGARTPSRKRAPPMPPASTTIRMSAILPGRPDRHRRRVAH